MIGRLLMWIRSRPISCSLVIIFIVGAILAGTLTHPASPDTFEKWGWSYSSLINDNNWITILTGVFVSPGPFHIALLVLLCLTIVGHIERLIGTWRLLIAIILTGIGSTLLVLLLQRGGSTIGELWIGTTLDQTVLDPFACLIGAIMTATAFMTTLWRRRIRIITLAILATYTLYSGDIVSIYRSMAAILGLELGFLLRGGRSSLRQWVSSRRETRTLLALIVAITAIGPIIAETQDVSVGPLAAATFLFDYPTNSPTVLFALIPLLLLSGAAWGIHSGRRVWLWVAIALETLLAGVATYGYFIDPLIDGGLPAFKGTSTELYAWWAAAALIPLMTAILLITNRRRIDRCKPQFSVGDTERNRFRLLQRRYGGNTLGFMGTWKDSLYWFNDEKNAAIAYRVIDHVALTLSDPVCNPKQQNSVLTAFVQFCDTHHWITAFYSIHSETASSLTSMGWYTMSVANEAIITPKSFRLRGPQAQNLRTATNHAQRKGIRAIWQSYSELSLAYRAQIVGLSEQWVADKHLPEMSFMLGGLAELKDSEVRLMIAVDQRDQIHAITSWLPIYSNDTTIGWTLDFMRRRDNAIYGVTDFLITQTILDRQAEGVEVISLAGTPLLYVSESSRSLLLSKLLLYIGQTLEPVYGFRSLAAFKRKYQPTYVPLSLAYRDPLSLGTIGKALAKAYLPDLTLRHIMKIIKQKEIHPSQKSSEHPR